MYISENLETICLETEWNTAHSKLEEVWHVKGLALISASGSSNIQLWQ